MGDIVPATIPAVFEGAAGHPWMISDFYLGMGNCKSSENSANMKKPGIIRAITQLIYIGLV